FGHFHGIAVNNLGIFISDGVVSPEIWYSQNVRIVFLLKEAYMSTSYVSYTKPIFEVIKIPKILEKSSFFACVESKCVI
ncbi:MAG: hypothetical protein SOW34_11385, partial [Oliverpabstia sp.]|nr:hypothetical protein [Oliverpabstia sp.]